MAIPCPIVNGSQGYFCLLSRHVDDILWEAEPGNGLAQAIDQLNTPCDRNMEMAGAGNRVALKEVIGPHGDFLQSVK